MEIFLLTRTFDFRLYLKKNTLMRLYSIYFLFFFSILSTALFAQEVDTTAWSNPTIKEDDTPTIKVPKIGIGITGNTYIGDLTDNFMKMNRFYPGVNFSLQTHGKPRKRLQMQLNVGAGSFTEQFDSARIASVPIPITIKPNTFVYTPFYYGDVRFRVKLFPKSFVTPFVGTGAGLILFSPQDADKNQLVEAPKTRPKGEEFSTSSFYIPAVTGLDFRINQMLGISLDYNLKYTFTDYLDNWGQLGTRSSKDMLQSFQMTVYITPTQPPASPKIYIPPVQPEPQDSLIADNEKPHKIKKVRNKRRKEQDSLPEVTPPIVVEIMPEPKPIDTLLEILFDLRPNPLEREARKPKLLRETIVTIENCDNYSLPSSEKVVPIRGRCLNEYVQVNPKRIKVPMQKYPPNVADELFTFYEGKDMKDLPSDYDDDESFTPVDLSEVLPEVPLEPGEHWEEEQLDIWIQLEEQALARKNYHYYECKPGDTYAELYDRFKVRKETLLALNSRASNLLPPVDGLLIMPDIRRWIPIYPDVDRIRREAGLRFPRKFRVKDR